LAGCELYFTCRGVDVNGFCVNGEVALDGFRRFNELWKSVCVINSMPIYQGYFAILFVDLDTGAIPFRGYLRSAVTALIPK